jgi:hypothetical protein
MVTWRWRRCPSCRAVARASDFACLNPYQGWGEGAVRRECPRCGWVGRTGDFQVIREYHPLQRATATAATGIP